MRAKPSGWRFRGSTSSLLGRRHFVVPGRGRLERDSYLAAAGGGTPTFTDDELKTIAAPLDFVGLNVYKPRAYVGRCTGRGVLPLECAGQLRVA